MYTARDGALKAGRVLLERGADVNATDPDNATALVLAIINYHYDFAQMLLDFKANPNIADTTGNGGSLRCRRHEFSALDVRQAGDSRAFEGHRPGTDRQPARNTAPTRTPH